MKFYSSNLLFVAVTLLIITSCGAPNKKKVSPRKEQKKIVSEVTVAKNSEEPFAGHEFINEPTQAQLKTLNKHLKPSTVGAIVDFIEQLKGCETDSSFNSLYYSFEKTTSQIEKEISKKYPDGYEGMTNLEVLNSIFALQSSCVAECTEFQFTFNLNDLLKLALATKGEMDERFIRLKIMAEGEHATYNPGWLNFFARTWDYGGGTLIGNDSIHVFLSETWKFMKETNLFKSDLTKLREQSIDYVEHRIYMYSKEKVQAEISLILKEKITSPAETKRLKAVLVNLNNTDLDPPLQFNCEDENSNCDWGG